MGFFWVLFCFKILMIEKNEQNIGKSWMSQVILPLVIISLLTGVVLCFSVDHFPPFYKVALSSLDAPWELQDQLLWFFPGVMVTAASGGEVGAFQTPQSFNCSCLSRKIIHLILNYALHSTCICFLISFQSSMCDISHSNYHHLKHSSTQAKCSSKDPIACVHPT